jgi:diguanylate cyclase
MVLSKTPGGLLAAARHRSAVLCSHEGRSVGRYRLRMMDLLGTSLGLAEAWLITLIALLSILVGGALLYWQHRAAGRASAPSEPAPAGYAAVALELDSEAQAVLRLIRAYGEAQERYSVCLAQADRHLPTLATPEEIGVIVKFLIAENARMQHEASDLKGRLEASKVQIEKLHSTLAEAQAISLRDPLTQLDNRRGFDANLTKAIGQAQALGTALCLVMGDIDNFKKVNDAFGHPIGDEILKIFAGVLAETVQDAGSVARYGGEEFAVILPGSELENAKELTERMRVELETKKLAVNNSGTEIGKITASFGIAQLSVGEDAQKLVQRADAKLYEAKCAGRNRVVAAERAVAS